MLVLSAFTVLFPFFLSRTLAAGKGQFGDARFEAGVQRIENGVRAECRDHFAGPGGGADGFVMFQRIQRGVCCGKDLDIEAVEQGARPEFRSL